MTKHADTEETELATMSKDHTENPYSDAYATFGDRMAAARDAQGLTQHEVAERLGVNARTIKGWEEDRSEPRSNRMQMLCGILNVSLVWLMTGQGLGVRNADEAPTDESRAQAAQAVLSEMSAIRSEQRTMADRLARLEKRLRAVLIE